MTRNRTKSEHLILLSLCLLSMMSTPLWASGSQEDTQITAVLDWTINTNHTGLYVAKELGFYEAAGLDVQIQTPPETGSASLIVSGQAEFAVSTQENVSYARAAGLPLSAIAAVIQHNSSGFAARREAGIQSPADFEGKSYGGWGSPVEEAMLRALMDEHNADYNTVKNISIGSLDFFAATSRNIDFTWIFEGWDGVAAELKGIDISFIRLADELEVLDYYTPVLISNENYIENHPGTVRSFLAATAEGYRYCIEHPQEAAEILLSCAPELDQELVRASMDFLAPRYQADAPYWGMMKKEVWRGYKEWLQENKLLDGDFPVDTAFTNRFLPGSQEQ